MAGLSLAITQSALIAGESFARASAAKAEADYFSTIARANANLARFRAGQALQAGQEQIAAERRAAKVLEGQARAAAGVSGVVGLSQEQVIAQSEIFSIEAQRIISNNAYREAFGFKVEASILEERARFARQQGRERFQSTLLSGGLRIMGELATAFPNTTPPTAQQTARDVTAAGRRATAGTLSTVSAVGGAARGAGAAAGRAAATAQGLTALTSIFD